MKVIARRAELLQALAAAEGQLDAAVEATAADGGLMLFLSGRAGPGALHVVFAQVALSVDVLEEGEAHLDVAPLARRLQELPSESVQLTAAPGSRDFTLSPVVPGNGHAGAWPAPAPSTPAGAAPYASWGSRVGAYLIDAIVLTGVFLAVGALLRHAGSGVVLAVAIAIQAAYFTFFHGSEHGQTLGKRALGIAVRRADDGGRCSYAQALGRYVIVLAFSFGFVVLTIVDDLWPLRDARRQALHDKVARTVVVRV